MNWVHFRQVEEYEELQKQTEMRWPIEDAINENTENRNKKNWILKWLLCAFWIFVLFVCFFLHNIHELYTHWIIIVPHSPLFVCIEYYYDHSDYYCGDYEHEIRLMMNILVETVRGDDDRVVKSVNEGGQSDHIRIRIKWIITSKKDVLLLLIILND